MYIYIYIYVYAHMKSEWSQPVSGVLSWQDCLGARHSQGPPLSWHYSFFMRLLWTLKFIFGINQIVSMLENITITKKLSNSWSCAIWCKIICPSLERVSSFWSCLLTSTQHNSNMVSPLVYIYIFFFLNCYLQVSAIVRNLCFNLPE